MAKKVFLTEEEQKEVQQVMQQADLDKRLKRIYGDDYVIGENFEINKKQL